jgi:hypothetical protein
MFGSHLGRVLTPSLLEERARTIAQSLGELGWPEGEVRS